MFASDKALGTSTTPKTNIYIRSPNWAVKQALTLGHSFAIGLALAGALWSL